MYFKTIGKSKQFFKTKIKFSKCLSLCLSVCFITHFEHFDSKKFVFNLKYFAFCWFYKVFHDFKQSKKVSVCRYVCLLIYIWFHLSVCHQQLIFKHFFEWKIVENFILRLKVSLFVNRKIIENVCLSVCFVSSRFVILNTCLGLKWLIGNEKFSLNSESAFTLFTKQFFQTRNFPSQDLKQRFLHQTN